MPNEWIPVFKTGTHTDSNGVVKEWTEKDLKNMVVSYDPSYHEAPVVIGHPKDNAPAYGWVKQIKYKGGVLYAQLKQLVPEFVEMVKKGMFKKRSISLYPDGTLRHIGFLGAMPPTVKGLPDVSFHEGGVSIEFEENQNNKEGKNMKFIEWLKGLAAKEGVTLEDIPQQQSFSEAEIQTRVDAELKKKEAEFSEKVVSLEETRKKKDAELKTREDALKAKEKEAKKKGIAAFCEGLAKEGKLTPAMLKHGMGMQNFLEQVGGIEAAIEFGEGDEKKKQTPIEFMQSFLSALPKAIEFGEVAGKSKDTGSGDGRKEKMIAHFMEKDQKATYRDAVLAVSKEHPELFKD